MEQRDRTIVIPRLVIAQNRTNGVSTLAFHLVSRNAYAELSQEYYALVDSMGGSIRPARNAPL